MTDSVLNINGLTKSFGGLLANDGISLELSAGDIHGLIGPNGAGKTTLFNTVTGFHTPDSGHVVYDGTDITGWKPHRIARHGLARTFQIPAPFETMSVRDNLLAVHADASMAEKRNRAAETLDLSELDVVADQPASDLSGGQQKLLELGRALMLDPNCVLLDEPTAGVNPALAERLLEYIHALNDNGTAFLVIEHDMGIMQNLADVVTVLDQGQIIAEGSFKSVTTDDRVMEAYLGSESDDAVLESLGEGNLATGARKTVNASEPADDHMETQTSTTRQAGISGQDIVSGYGDHQVLNDISFESQDGITGVFGPNGSGKSTLLKSLNGLLSVWSGTVTFQGDDVTTTPPEELVRNGVATLQQDSGVFDMLTVEENLRIGAYHVSDDVLVENRLETVLNTFPALQDRRGAKAKSLSGGQRMMVSFGRAMMTGADVYLLDEPSAGLSPSLVDDVFDMVERLADEGGEIVLVEQNVRDALEIIDYVYILAQGRVQFEGTPAELAERENLLNVYLGLS